MKERMGVRDEVRGADIKKRGTRSEDRPGRLTALAGRWTGNQKPRASNGGRWKKGGSVQPDWG